MTERRAVGSGAPWETVVGYSRAVRVGPFIAVAGTTASGPDGVVSGSDVAAQTREVLTRIEVALGRLGATLADVVRTRICPRGG